MSYFEMEQTISCQQMEIEDLHQQLAASQAREQQLLEALQEIAGDCGSAVSIVSRTWSTCSKALALPTDTSALEALIAKAGEVMRERCWQTAQPEDSYQDEWFRAKADSCVRIRAIPGVKLDDLK